MKAMQHFKTNKLLLTIAMGVQFLQAQTGQKLTHSNCVPYYPREAGDKIIFMGQSNGYGLEPWICKKDGSGSQQIKDIRQGTASSMGGPYADRNELRTLNNQVFFFANDGFKGTELWKTDGTSSGTVIVKEIGVGSNGANGQFTSVDPLNGNIIFYANDGTGYDLWRTDGTETGTVKISNLKLAAAPYMASYYLERSQIVYNNKLYLIINQKLYAINGSDFSITLLEAGGSWTPVSLLIPFQNKIYFFRQMGNYASLWQTDGTLSNTKLIKDKLYSANVNGNTQLPQCFGVSDNLIFLEMKRTTNGKTFTSELWKSDGTAAGTVFVKSFLSSINDMLVIKNKVYFTAWQDAQMNGVWASDGTDANTNLVFNFEYNTSFPAGAWWSSNFRNYKDSLLFSTTSAKHFGVYLTDGTSTGTKRILDFNGVSDMFVSNSVIYLNALADIYRYPGVSNITHAHQPKRKSGFQVYPNPTSDVLHIYYPEPAQLFVYSTDGRLVLSLINPTTVRVDNISPGAYKLVLISQGAVMTETFIKE